MREFIEWLFTSRYVLHLEEEVRQLRGERERLLIQLQVAQNPPPAPVVERKFPKFMPVKTSWEKFLAEQMALQEKEENGTPSSRRNDVDERQSGS